MRVGPKLMDELVQKHGQEGDAIGYSFNSLLNVVIKSIHFIIVGDEKITIVPVTPYVAKMKEPIHYFINDVTSVSVNGKKVTISFADGKVYNLKFPSMTSNMSTYQSNLIHRLSLLENK